MNTTIPLELQKDFFKDDVTFHNGLAKWHNYKHPENISFQQKVFWAAYEAHGNLIICYYLDQTAINKNYHHACLPLNGKSFEDAVFEYWSDSWE